MGTATCPRCVGATLDGLDPTVPNVFPTGTVLTDIVTNPGSASAIQASTAKTATTPRTLMATGDPGPTTHSVRSHAARELTHGKEIATTRGRRGMEPTAPWTGATPSMSSPANFKIAPTVQHLSMETGDRGAILHLALHPVEMEQFQELESATILLRLQGDHSALDHQTTFKAVHKTLPVLSMADTLVGHPFQIALWHA